MKENFTRHEENGHLFPRTDAEKEEKESSAARTFSHCINLMMRVVLADVSGTKHSEDHDTSAMLTPQSGSSRTIFLFSLDRVSNNSQSNGQTFYGL